MRLMVLQHVPFEGPARIADWAAERGHTLECRHVYRGDPLPLPQEYDWLVIMGGPMSVNDEAALSWLRPEKQCVDRALSRGRKVLGVCLGAQMLANVLGQRVYRNRVKEIGWLDVELRPAALASPVFRATFLQHLPPRVPVFQWHGETFDLPHGARLMASSAVCEQQAFEWTDGAAWAWGLQFHVESTPASVAALIENCRDDFATPGPCVQSEAELRRTDRCAALHPLLYAWLDGMARA